MPEQENIDKQYIKRVNDGYLLAKHMPELAAQIKQSVKEKEDGLIAGIEQFDKEKDKSIYPAWMNPNRLDELDKESDLDIDLNRDDLEIE